MTKLSPSLKALINARPGPAPASALIRRVYEGIARDAQTRGLGTRPWLTISTAATCTVNSPDSLLVLYGTACAQGRRPGNDDNNALTDVQAAELMREVGLKCISFNGIARTINMLNAFRAGLPVDVAGRLETRPSRDLAAAAAAAAASDDDDVLLRGRRLWDSIYAPFEQKLLDKLALAHPDLPLHILQSHYGPLLSDPRPSTRGSLAATGRVLTSLVAIACLRAQPGVAPQLLSHVFGLRKAYEDGSYKADEPGARVDERTVAWLAGDEGLEWILTTVDGIADALTASSNLAQSQGESKL